MAVHPLPLHHDDHDQLFGSELWGMVITRSNARRRDMSEVAVLQLLPWLWPGAGAQPRKSPVAHRDPAPPATNVTGRLHPRPAALCVHDHDSPGGAAEL